MSAVVPEWLRDPALDAVWAAARERLERNGVEPRGSVTVHGLDRTARHALSGLLGRPVLRDSVRVDLASLDAVLRERSGAGGLVTLLEAFGAPVRNRSAERSLRAAGREAPYVAVRAWLAEHPEVAAQPWVEEWLAGVRRSGVLTRERDPQIAAGHILRAVELAARLLGHPVSGALSRTELAARSTGDAHALDDGSVVGQLVLRALAVDAGESAPATAAGRRALWERCGVSADTVSSTCLVLGLLPLGDSPTAQRLRLAAEAGDPMHVTAWDLARDALAVPAGVQVLVCENPRVLEAIAQHGLLSGGVLCTSGTPGLVAVEVLQRLARCGARLAYHGDFDWPGIAIANRLLAQVGARPWRMSATDYLAAARADGPRLEGVAVTPAWDPSLDAAMRDRGVAVHEEAVLDSLLDSLDRHP